MICDISRNGRPGVLEHERVLAAERGEDPFLEGHGDRRGADGFDDGSNDAQLVSL
jgi:hypothetical protein